MIRVLVLSPQKKDQDSRERRALIIDVLGDLKTKLLNPSPGRPPKKKDFPPTLFPQFFSRKKPIFYLKPTW